MTSPEQEQMYKDISKLTHKYGLQEVRAVIEARYQAMMRDVAQFRSELIEANHDQP